MQNRYAEMPARRVRPVQMEELRHDVLPGQDDDLLALHVLHGRDECVDRPRVRDAALGALPEVAESLHAASTAALGLGVDGLLRLDEILALADQARSVEIRGPERADRGLDSGLGVVAG